MSTTTTEDLMSFEKRWLNQARDGRYEAAVRHVFGVSVIAHAQRVVATLEDGSAHRVDPVTARILGDRLDSNRKQRGDRGARR